MMIHLEHITPKVKLDLKLHCQIHVYVIIVMHIYKKTTKISNTGAAAVPNNGNKKMIFKNCAVFADSINEINNAHIDNAEDTDVSMPMYDFI